MAALIVLRHRTNIVKLARGEESRVGEKKVARPPP
jgi:glycerol-3-phosphate acyltransferase PlsY